MQLQKSLVPQLRLAERLESIAKVKKSPIDQLCVASVVERNSDTRLEDDITNAGPSNTALTGCPK